MTNITEADQVLAFLMVDTAQQIVYDAVDSTDTVHEAQQYILDNAPSTVYASMALHLHSETEQSLPMAMKIALRYLTDTSE